MRISVLAWLIILSLMWGPAFLLMKVAVAELPPLTIAATRVSLAAVLLFLFLHWQRQTLPRFGPIWKHFAVTGLITNALPYALITWGEQYIDSALASILIGTEPVFTLIFVQFLATGERLTPAKIGGVTVGFCGLIVLFAPEIAGGFQVTTLGLLAVTAAAASYSYATIYAQKHITGLPPLVAPTAQLIMASLYLVPAALVAEQPYLLPVPSLTVVGALITLAVVCTALTFVIFFRLLERTTPIHLTLVTYMVPIVGTGLGIAVLGEEPGWSGFLGCGLIIVSVAVVEGAFKPVLAWRRTRAAISA